jgi:hypothetical protein
MGVSKGERFNLTSINLLRQTKRALCTLDRKGRFADNWPIAAILDGFSRLSESKGNDEVDSRKWRQ